ncbi:hypothetical protein CA13_45190 [Planctomycetes bacterium CA13]|uniref:Uncharacterized protein n=1 Tax=Novipirellula herctigrandis TaxID=2527986 RepID=A0A5C5Z7L7_9BACT|nr:hypothetical protein CA13_45190 [Planctomycetes bacterium CA13]
MTEPNRGTKNDRFRHVELLRKNISPPDDALNDVEATILMQTNIQALFQWIPEGD